MKLKKTKVQGTCAAVRCKLGATDLLCPAHEQEWKDQGAPNLGSNLPTQVQADLTGERHAMQQVLARLQALPISTQEDLDKLGDFAGQVQTRIKELETQRKTVTDPLNQAVKEINSWFRPVTDTCKAVVSSCKEMIQDRLKAMQAEQDKALRLVEAGGGVADRATLMLAHDSVEAPANVSARTSLSYRVVHDALIPQRYWKRVLDHDAIMSEIDLHGKATDIPGLEIIVIGSLTVRGT